MYRYWTNTSSIFLFQYLYVYIQYPNGGLVFFQTYFLFTIGCFVELNQPYVVVVPGAGQEKLTAPAPIHIPVHSITKFVWRQKFNPIRKIGLMEFILL
jgi:hypothetical protein